MRHLAAVQHTRPGRQDRRVTSSEPVVELGGSFYLGVRGVCGGGEPSVLGKIVIAHGFLNRGWRCVRRTCMGHIAQW